ncbi:hypothetical protein Shyhy01_57920 [Streptomyces hygroscopicus subsp. hygroscopicus]|nr:hypothetical protein Shyhy01_57920 [Streptomyces hygroscopicus subsp. hygroscopicus]
MEERGPPARSHTTPTEVTVGRSGELHVFARPVDPAIRTAEHPVTTAASPARWAASGTAPGAGGAL